MGSNTTRIPDRRSGGHQKNTVTDAHTIIIQNRQLLVNGVLVGDVSQIPLLLIHACVAASKHSVPYPDAATITEGQKWAYGVSSVPKATFQKMWIRGMSYASPSSFIKWLQALGIFIEVFPTVEKSVTCIEKNNAANTSTRTTFEHSVATLEVMTLFTDDPILRTVAFLHDMGKPETRQLSSKKTLTFYKHEHVGANIVQSWMSTYLFPSCDIIRVTNLIRNHMFYFAYNSTDKVYKRFLAKMRPTGWKELMLLRLADRRGNSAKKDLPAITWAMKQTFKRIWNIMQQPYPIFKEEVNITPTQLRLEGFTTCTQEERVWGDLFGMLTKNKEKNTKDELLEYVRKLPYRSVKENGQTA